MATEIIIKLCHPMFISFFNLDLQEKMFNILKLFGSDSEGCSGLIIKVSFSTKIISEHIVNMGNYACQPKKNTIKNNSIDVR